MDVFSKKSEASETAEHPEAAAAAVTGPDAPDAKPAPKWEHTLADELEEFSKHYPLLGDVISQYVAKFAK